MNYVHWVRMVAPFSGMLLGAIAGRPKRTDLATELVQAIQQGRLCIVDLTYDLDEKSPCWPDGSASSPFHATTVATLRERCLLAATAFKLPSTFGTHMDAPLHVKSRGASLNEMAGEKLIVPAVVVDVSAAATSSPDYLLTVEDLEKWAKAHGPEPRVRSVDSHRMGVALAFPGAIREPGRAGRDAFPRAVN